MFVLAVLVSSVCYFKGVTVRINTNMILCQCQLLEDADTSGLCLTVLFVWATIKMDG